MLQTCLKLVLIHFELYNPNCSSLEKWCLRKHHVAHPIFWSFRITKSGKIRICEKTQNFTLWQRKTWIRILKYGLHKGIFEKFTSAREDHKMEEVILVYNYSQVDHIIPILSHIQLNRFISPTMGPVLSLTDRTSQSDF